MLQLEGFKVVSMPLFQSVNGIYAQPESTCFVKYLQKIVTEQLLRKVLCSPNPATNFIELSVLCRSEELDIVGLSACLNVNTSSSGGLIIWSGVVVQRERFEGMGNIKLPLL